MNLLNRLAVKLHQPVAGENMQGLPDRMRVPCGARARFKAYPEDAQARRLRADSNFIDPDVSGEPFRLAFPAGPLFAAPNLHFSTLLHTTDSNGHPCYIRGGRCCFALNKFTARSCAG